MAEGVIELTEASFSDQVSSGVTLVDFWAPWCGPCKMQGPILEKLAGTIGDRAVIAKVNVDDAGGVAGEYGIRSIPTLMVFKDGEVVQQLVGLQKEDTLTQAIEAAV
jgi:thioredoxin 1